MKCIFARVGGKHLLKKKIISLFPKNYEKMIYCEVFCGGASVFFGKILSIKEIINDLDGNLINIYKIIQNGKFDQVQIALKNIPNRRKIFNIIKRHYLYNDLQNLPLIQRGVYWLYLMYLSFGCNMGRPTYSAIQALHNRTDHVINLDIKPYFKRLQNVVITNEQYYKAIIKHDSSNTLFYLDPPYYNLHNETHYRYDQLNPKLLASILYQIKGRFLLTYNDCQFIRRLYKKFNIIGVSQRYLLSVIRRKGKQLIITNY